MKNGECFYMAVKRTRRERKEDEMYQRVLEILDDYWLSEPDELAVVVRMDFLKANGEEQSKCLTWANDEISPDEYPKAHDMARKFFRSFI